MLSKTNIFDDIKNILSNDYAGFIDKKDINNPSEYTIFDDMNDREFEEEIQNYLLDFNDGHLWFNAKKSTVPNRGFSVHRFENNLYVTESLQEKRLRVGDKITQVDGNDIAVLTIKYAKRLEEKDNERQLWNGVLRRLSRITVQREKSTFELDLSDYESEPYKSKHSFKRLDENTAVMKITDFAEEKPILDIIQNNQSALKEVKNLIIDVRVNYGGNDEFYFSLLHYIFGENILFKDLFTADEAMYTNYTKRNCELWISELKDYMEQELDESTIQSLNRDIEEVKSHCADGFIEVPEEDDFEIKGMATPNNIYIMTDYFCGSSGETFISNAKKSNKVTVVGRPTMGIMDYFNVVTVDYGDFELSYSISKMHENSFTYGKGIQPDIYIPWTPAHIEEDQDLNYVLEIIKKNQ